MNTVVPLRPARATERANESETRALALLGDTPRVTLVDGNDPDTCLSLRLVRAGAVWLGLVDDRAALLDRVRLGLKPRFVVHPDSSTSTVSGDIDVRILGRAEIVVATDARIKQLVDVQPFGLVGAVVVELAPRGLALEPIETGVVGAVPRT